MIVPLVLSMVMAAANPIEYPPHVSGVSVQELLRQSGWITPVYDEPVVVAYLAEHGPGTDEFIKILEDDEAQIKATYKAEHPDFDIRRRWIGEFLGRGHVALQVLERRAKTDNALRDT